MFEQFVPWSNARNSKRFAIAVCKAQNDAVNNGFQLSHSALAGLIRCADPQQQATSQRCVSTGTSDPGPLVAVCQTLEETLGSLRLRCTPSLLSPTVHERVGIMTSDSHTADTAECPVRYPLANWHY
jgi:hypothetical protein